jgi:predicted Zn-dependent peptidase
MKKIQLLLFVFVASISIAIAQNPIKYSIASTYQKVTDPSGKFSYIVYSNDPLQSRWYTLPNGLTVVMSVNKAEPRVQTLIATKAGSKNDPAENTGLAHYLEHLLFKGTDKYGTLDYAKEKVYLDQIDALYETYNKTKDEAKRKTIYRQIDSVSGLAAKYAIANEYDKMMQVLGASGTNAFTSFEQTVYVNDLPSNQMSSWLTVEAERFRNPVLRLFHTELEAVYEEKNISLDNDSRKASEAMLASLFRNHNYGLQTTIGTVEHLKNPSIQKIRDYYNTNYVPNNMAIILAGDIDPDKLIIEISEKFSYMKRAEVQPYVFKPEMPRANPDKIEITGPDAEFLQFGYRIPGGAGTQESLLLELTDLILSNSKAGLIDLNINQAQKTLSSGSGPWILKDYSIHFFNGKPKTGQTLEEVQALLMAEIDKVKKGDFDMELIKSIILNKQVADIRNYEENSGRAYFLLDVFNNDVNYINEINKAELMQQVTKQEIIDFANEFYTQDYTVVYKRAGKATDVQKVDKPTITQVEVNRDETSPFVTAIINAETPRLAPVFVDFTKDIERGKLNGKLPVYSVKNKENQLFSLYYILDIGSRHDKKMAMAVSYLKYLGTKTMSADEVNKSFYKLACDFGVSSGEKQSYVYLSGIQSNFEQALALFEKLLAEAEPNNEQLTTMVERIVKGRQDSKLNKRAILWGPLRNYAVYGKDNPSNDILSETQLKALTGKELTTYIHNLTAYPHKVYYYGPLTNPELVTTLTKYHKPRTMMAAPTEKKYVKQQSAKPIIYFVDYDMVQAEIIWHYNSNQLNVKEAPMVAMFNEYFGGGMSSIVFQTIRESKALAYSTYSVYSTGVEKGETNTVLAYIGTQADKINEAIKGMDELLQELPQSENAFSNAKEAVKNNIETQRTLKTSILFALDNAEKMSIDYDIRKDTYKAIDGITLQDLNDFHKQKFSGKPYAMAILGSKSKIDLKELEKYGEVKILTLEEIFGY